MGQDHQNLAQGLGKCYSTIVCFELLRFIFNAVVMQCHGAAVCIFTAFQAAMMKNQSVELFYKVRNGWDQSGLELGYSLAKLLVVISL